MNASEIYELLWKDQKTSSYVMAVIPSEALPYVQPDYRKRCYIVNTMARKKCYSPLGALGALGGLGGLGVPRKGHWLLIVIIHGEAVELFDSLGQDGTWNGDIMTFINHHGYINVNGRVLASSLCGYYCLAYAYYRARGIETVEVLDILKNTVDIESHCLTLFD